MRSDAPADLVSEIYAGRSHPPLPASVAQALTALALARRPRATPLRDASWR